MLGSKLVNSLRQFWTDKSIPLQILHHSSLSWKVNSSSNFASLFVVTTPNCHANFKLIYFLLWIKGSHQSHLIFRFSNVPGENLLNSSCHFWKHRSVFLQILHQYSVPRNITPLYIFSSKIIYFRQKQSIKGQFFEIFECSGQHSSNTSCQFWTDKSISLQFCIILHCPDTQLHCKF